MKPSSVRSAALFFAFGLPLAMPVCAQTDTPPSSPAQNDVPPSPPGGGPHRGGFEHRVEMLQRALSLTPDQTTQVKAILGAERSKMEALRSNTSLAGEDRHNQMMAVHQDTTTRMHTVLTADQATKYDSLEARMREHRPGNGEGPPPPPSASQGPGER